MKRTFRMTAARTSTPCGVRYTLSNRSNQAHLARQLTINGDQWVGGANGCSGIADWPGGGEEECSEAEIRKGEERRRVQWAGLERV